MHLQFLVVQIRINITSYDGARSKITKVERDELLEEFVKAYIEKL